MDSYRKLIALIWRKVTNPERCAFCGRQAELGRSYCSEHDSTDWEPWK